MKTNWFSKFWDFESDFNIKYEVDYIECILFASHWVKYFIRIILLNPHNNPRYLNFTPIWQLLKLKHRDVE